MLNKKSRLYNLLILPSISIIILAGFLLTFSVNIFAAGSDSGSYFPMDQNINEHFTDADINFINSLFNSNDDQFIFAYFSGYAPGYGTRMKNFYIITIPQSSDTMIYGEVSSNLYQFSIYSIGSTIPDSYCHYLQILEQN